MNDLELPPLHYEVDQWFAFGWLAFVVATEKGEVADGVLVIVMLTKLV